MYIYNYLLVIIYCNVIFAKFIGKHDKRICKQNPHTILSCTHQIKKELRSIAECDVETISPEKCPFYDVDKVFDPFEIPFEIQVYKFRDVVLRTVALNITFPHPTWSRMNMYLQNQLMPKYKICRKFRVDHLVPLAITSPIFWDCLLFSADAIEENYYNLFLENEENIGGIYSFRIPSVKNYDIEATNISSWHVFMFLHQHYLESTGRLVVTLQPAPFPNISYAISLVECLGQSHKCEHNSVMQTIFIHQERYYEDNKSVITIELKRVTVPGTYAVTIQILSKSCYGERCELSVSPTFELKRSYGVEIVLGLLAVIILICLTTFLIMRKLHLDFHRYMERKSLSMDTVLFVYHAHTEDAFFLLWYLSRVLQQLTVRPLLVDKHVGAKDPNDWMRYQLSHASKVIFFAPCGDPSHESATPIQHQWHCALRYFSGRGFLKEDRNVASRCAVVTLPNSLPLAQGNELYSLRRFELKKDLVRIANWLHRDRFLDRFLFWRPIVKEFTGQLSMCVHDCTKPRMGEALWSEWKGEESVHRGGNGEIALVGGGCEGAKEALMEGCSVDCGGEKIGSGDVDEKVRREFDPLLPDAGSAGERELGRRDDEIGSSGGGDSSSSLSDGELSDTDVLNFAT